MPQLEPLSQSVPRRVVITAVRNADKAVVLGFMGDYFDTQATIAADAAEVIVKGGFPVGEMTEIRKAALRATYFTQREVEEAAAATGRPLILLTRSTIDVATAWPGPEDFWNAVGTTVHHELARYSAVIHLRRGGSPETGTETRLEQAWVLHRRRYVVDLSQDRMQAAARILGILRDEMAAPADHPVVSARTPAPTLLRPSPFPDDGLQVPDAYELWGEEPPHAARWPAA